MFFSFGLGLVFTTIVDFIFLEKRLRTFMMNFYESRWTKFKKKLLKILKLIEAFLTNSQKKIDKIISLEVVFIAIGS